MAIGRRHLARASGACGFRVFAGNGVRHIPKLQIKSKPKTKAGSGSQPKPKPKPKSECKLKFNTYVCKFNLKCAGHTRTGPKFTGRT